MRDLEYIPFLETRGRLKPRLGERQACLCIRNIAARGPTLRPAMLDEGCEAVLREAGKLRGCIDEAYGALRDLKCEVRYKRYCGFEPI